MKKLIIEIDDKQYEDAINDTEWDTLSLGIYLKELVKNAKPLQAELEEEFKRIKADVYNLTPLELIHKARILNILDNRISELKGE